MPSNWAHVHLLLNHIPPLGVIFGLVWLVIAARRSHCSVHADAVLEAGPKNTAFLRCLGGVGALWKKLWKSAGLGLASRNRSPRKGPGRN